MYVKHLECICCGKKYLPDPNRYLCPDCGEDGLLEVVYDYSDISRVASPKTLARDRDRSMWRYLPFLPVEEPGRGSRLQVGGTPLYNADRLARHLGLKQCLVKDDAHNPTGSLKDRASAVAVAKAVEAGANTVACSSTGNAASSLAGNAASAGMNAFIFVPERAPQGKIAQILMYGANIILVQGTYEQTYQLSAAMIDRFRWYNRNAAINPYLVEGKKTVALEIAEQLGWKVPDWVVVSVGDGCTVAGVWKGFFDLQQCGFIAGVPRILGVQAKGCAPLVKAFDTGRHWEPSPENTLADSIAVGSPRNPAKALRAVRRSGGRMIAVEDQDILAAIRTLGRFTGVFAEPAAAASLAGLERAIGGGIVEPDETVVLVVTGNGLKDVKNALAAGGEVMKTPPVVEEASTRIERLLDQQGRGDTNND